MYFTTQKELELESQFNYIIILLQMMQNTTTKYLSEGLEVLGGSEEKYMKI